MGIRHPIISEIAPETYLINEFGLCNHYLLVGSERVAHRLRHGVL